MTPEAHGWQDIATAPMYDVVYVHGRHPYGTPWWNIGVQIVDGHWDCSGVSMDPTHWQPLPPPPVQS